MDNHACACDKLIDFDASELISWDNLLVNNTNVTTSGCVATALQRSAFEQRQSIPVTAVLGMSPEPCAAPTVVEPNRSPVTDTEPWYHRPAKLMEAKRMWLEREL